MSNGLILTKRGLEVVERLSRLVIPRAQSRLFGKRSSSGWVAFVETKGSFVLFPPMFYLIIYREREYKISFNNNEEMIPLV